MTYLYRMKKMYKTHAALQNVATSAALNKRTAVCSHHQLCLNLFVDGSHLLPCVFPPKVLLAISTTRCRCHVLRFFTYVSAP